MGSQLRGDGAVGLEPGLDDPWEDQEHAQGSSRVEASALKHIGYIGVLRDAMG